ncbi:Hypothetical predicted protein [Octopus vulgaris]|uniref:Uncharacterized protein n=1 Tax=Octopus vulgaris TaxID=6645 RepID=A0AA36EXC8_OCTVU|nr:Hypothetical predicted protein [Octopus vulgaris]
MCQREIWLREETSDSQTTIKDLDQCENKNEFRILELLKMTSEREKLSAKYAYLGRFAPADSLRLQRSCFIVTVIGVDYIDFAVSRSQSDAIVCSDVHIVDRSSQATC